MTAHHAAYVTMVLRVHRATSAHHATSSRLSRIARIIGADLHRRLFIRLRRRAARHSSARMPVIRQRLPHTALRAAAALPPVGCSARLRRRAWHSALRHLAAVAATHEAISRRPSAVLVTEQRQHRANGRADHVQKTLGMRIACGESALDPLSPSL
jgi:hypothetical protein